MVPKLRKFTRGSTIYYRKASHVFVIVLILFGVFVTPLLPSSFAQERQPTSPISFHNNVVDQHNSSSSASNFSTSQQQPPVNYTTSDIWFKVVALPLFNDSLLGTSNITQYDPVIPGLGNIYNFILIVSIIIIMVGAALALILGRMGKQGTNSMMMEIVIGLIAVLAFPSVYDGIARMINYLAQALIAYPNPYYDYGSALQVLWNNMEFAQGWSAWTLLANSFFQVVFFIVSGIVYVMLFFLGVARLFLIGAMIVAFPLSMGLRLIPFTKKLSSMIEDTLFGLMLAPVMSAVVLGVGSYILSPGIWNSSSGNIFFQAVGQNGQNWIAAAALLTAILIPTILAPLTATTFQSASQIAMSGVGVSTMVAVGAASGGIGGVAAAGSAIGTLGKTAQITGQPPPSVAQKLVAGMKAFGNNGLPAIGYNVATLGTSGFVSATGARAAGFAMRRAMPLKTPQAIELRARVDDATQIGQAHIDAAMSAINSLNGISLSESPVSDLHRIHPETRAAFPTWEAVELPRDQKIELIDPKNEEQLIKFKSTFPSHQSLSELLVDSKVITSQASKNPDVQAHIRHLHSKVSGLDPRDNVQSQQLANFHNHLAVSKKLGRALKENDFKEQQ